MGHTTPTYADAQFLSGLLQRYQGGPVRTETDLANTTGETGMAGWLGMIWGNGSMSSLCQTNDAERRRRGPNQLSCGRHNPAPMGAFADLPSPFRTMSHNS